MKMDGAIMLNVQKYLFDKIKHPYNKSNIERAPTEFKVELFKNLEKDFGIRCKFYTDENDLCVVLNYDQINSPKMDIIVQECRGLILSLKDLSVISKAFNRFFNYGEADTSSFNFEGSIIFDKIDGSLCPMYYHPYRKTWMMRTRGTAFGETFVGDTKFTFYKLAMEACGLPDLTIFNKSSLDKNKTYIFELTSPENKVVTPYFDRRLHYLGSIDNRTNEEVDYNQGYKYIVGFGLRAFKVNFYNFTNLDEVIKIVHKMPPTQEGYVVLNKQFQRVKVKNPGYVALAHLHNNGAITNRRIIDIIANNETDEFLTYFPEQENRFNEIKKAKKNLFDSIEKVYEKIQNIENQKDFALEANKYNFSSVLFCLRRGDDIESVWNNMNIKKKLSLLNLKDDEENV